MARHRHHELGELEVEVLDGPSLDEQQVEFGRRSGRRPPTDADPGAGEPGSGRRRGRMLLGVAGVVAAIVAVAVATSGGGDDGSSPTRSVPRTTRPSLSDQVTSLPTTVPRTTDPLAPVPSIRPDVVTIVTVAPPVNGTFPPFVPDGREIVPVPQLPGGGSELAAAGSASVLYLWDTALGPTALASYDLATGTLSELVLGQFSGPIRAVVPVGEHLLIDAGEVGVIDLPGGPIDLPFDGAEPALVAASGPRVVAGSDGQVWVRTLDPATVLRYDAARAQVLERRNLPLGVELIGTTSDGRPVVRGPDLRSYLIDANGSALLYDSGITTPVERGQYASITCDPPTECVVTLHSALLVSRFSLGVAADLDRTLVRFAPVGGRVAIARDGLITIVDLLGGPSVDVPISYVPTGDPVSVPAANYFGIARDLLWTADGKALGMLTDTGIVFIDVEGTPIATIVIDEESPLRFVPLAVG